MVAAPVVVGMLGAALAVLALEAATAPDPVEEMAVVPADEVMSVAPASAAFSFPCPGPFAAGLAQSSNRYRAVLRELN